MRGWVEGRVSWWDCGLMGRRINGMDGLMGENVDGREWVNGGVG